MKLELSCEIETRKYQHYIIVAFRILVFECKPNVYEVGHYGRGGDDIFLKVSVWVEAPDKFKVNILIATELTLCALLHEINIWTTKYIK